MLYHCSVIRESDIEDEVLHSYGILLPGCSGDQQGIHTNLAIDVQVIFYLIDKLNADKSPGADGIHQRGLEEFKGEIGGLWAKTCKSSLQRDAMIQRAREAG